MSAIHRLCRRTTLALIVSAGLLGSAAALAQQRQIDVHWSPQASTPTAFDIALKQRADGRLTGAIVPQEPRMRAVGQRSVLRAPMGERGMQMGLRTLLQHQGPSGLPVARGKLSVQVDAPAGPVGGSGGGDIVVLDIVDSATGQPTSGGGGGDIIIFDIVDSVASPATRIRIDARPGQQLEGSAAHWQWFNRPGPGEPLIATIPALQPGQVLNEVLEIRDVRDPLALPLAIGLRMQF